MTVKVDRTAETLELLHGTPPGIERQKQTLVDELPFLDSKHPLLMEWPS